MNAIDLVILPMVARDLEHHVHILIDLFSNECGSHNIEMFVLALRPFPSQRPIIVMRLCRRFSQSLFPLGTQLPRVWAMSVGR